MERLTELRKGQWVIPLQQGGDRQWCLCSSGMASTKYLYGDHVDRLAAYEDTGLEPEQVRALVVEKEAGRLVVVPCKVGNTVYQTDGIRVYKSEIRRIVFDTDGIAFDERAIGKSVFLTREEAEAAMKEDDAK